MASSIPALTASVGTAPFVTFRPSRVDGATDVVTVSVTSRGLHLVSERATRVVRFPNIARYPRPEAFWKTLARVGFTRKWLRVADRDWFHAPPDRFFRFYTSPPLTVFMPVDEAQDYDASVFAKVRATIESEQRFCTVDLG